MGRSISNPNHDAVTIAKILVEQVFSRYGTPLSLLSDQGRDVDGNLMKSVCDMLGIEKLRTSPYKPSTDAVDRLHRTLNSILGKTVSAHQKDWDLRLSSAMAAYRASRHDATGYSPNMLMMGREVRMPVDIMYGSPEEVTADYDGYTADIQHRLTTAFEDVRKELRRSAERNKKYYDMKVRTHRYEIGQWVYYFNPRKRPGRQDKWERKYTGPFLVVSVPSPVNVTIQRTARAKAFTVHIDKVKAYNRDDTPMSWLNRSTRFDKACQTDGTDHHGSTDTENKAESATVRDSHSQSQMTQRKPTPVINGNSDEAGIGQPDTANTDTPRNRPKRLRRSPTKFKDYVRCVRNDENPELAPIICYCNSVTGSSREAPITDHYSC